MKPTEHERIDRIGYGACSKIVDRDRWCFYRFECPVIGPRGPFGNPTRQQLHLRFGKWFTFAWGRHDQRVIGRGDPVNQFARTDLPGNDGRVA